MPRLPTRLAICVHEAGHAIVQLAHGSHPWIDYIAVDGLSGDNLGRVETISCWQPSNLKLAADRDVHEAWTGAAWRDVVNYLAGPIAELRWRRHSRVGLWLAAEEMAERCLGQMHEDHTDFGRVRRRLECAVPGDDRENFVKAWLEADEEVARWWPEITALGRLLAERGRVVDEDLYPLWRGMRDAKKPLRSRESLGL